VEGGEETTVSGETLWHLLLARPELCARHLIPCLEQLRGDWGLAAQAGAVEEALERMTQRETVVSAAEVGHLVEQLGQPSFSVRQAAYRSLVEHGPAVLPHLSALPSATLDAEQRVRLAEVRRKFTFPTADSPQRVAAWLCNDRALWEALAERDDPAWRALAAEQLARLGPLTVKR
jgi:hypothetical protein